jgi:hypothetical protein
MLLSELLEYLFWRHELLIQDVYVHLHEAPTCCDYSLSFVFIITRKLTIVILITTFGILL